MTISFTDILYALCSRVDPLNENENQHIFALHTPREAQLVNDILVAYGFDTRLYHEPDISKLYITKTSIVWHSQNDLENALTYAKTIKRMLFGMQEHADECYKISFQNTPDSGKQISILFRPENQPSEPPPPVIPTPASSDSARAYTIQKRKSSERDSATNILMGTTASQLSKHTPFGLTNDPLSTPIEPNLSRRLSVYFFGNLTEGLYAFLLGAFVAMLIASAIMITRGFLCADIAALADRAWYCEKKN